MSKEERRVRSSATPEAVPAAPEAHQVSRSSLTAVANVRTIEDVQRDIQKADKKFSRALERYEDAVSAYEAALDASKSDPTNEDLSKEVEDARELMYAHKSSKDDSAQLYTDLRAELARLQRAASAPSVQKGKSSFCVYCTLCLTIVCLESLRVGLRFRQSIFFFFFCSHEVVVPACPSSSLITGGDLVEQTIRKKLLAALHASGYKNPDHVAIGSMFRFHLNELKAFLDDDDALLEMYHRAAEYPGAMTRFAISESTGLSLATPALMVTLMMDNPNIIPAVTKTGEARMVKVLFPGGGRGLSSIVKRLQVENEVECAKLFTSLIAEQKDLALVPCSFEAVDKANQVSANNGGDRDRRLVYALIMEKYEGTVGKSPQNYYPHILRQTLRLRDAVERIHAEGYVHMDIKPSNIFIKGGLWYLGDYGSCRSSTRKELITSSTPGMYPFELDRGAIRAEPKYDFYMLGLTLLLALNIEEYRSLDLTRNPASEHKKLIEESIADLMEGKQLKHPCGGDEKTRLGLVDLIKDLFTRGGCTFGADGKVHF